MESFLSDYLVIFQNLVLPGFFYLLGFIVLLQAYTRIDALQIFNDNKQFALYISILVVVFSFIIGLVIFLAEQEVKTWFFPSVNGTNQAHPYPKFYQNVYCVLIMIRHLILSIVFLVLTTAFYLIRKKKRLDYKWFFTIMYTFLMAILTLSYLRIKEILDKNWNTSNPISKGWIVGVIGGFFCISLIVILWQDGRARRAITGANPVGVDDLPSPTTTKPFHTIPSQEK
jgi:hypothetical protein